MTSEAGFDMVSALRSGLVWFFTLLKGGPRTRLVLLFQRYLENWTGPYRTGPLWFRAVTGPVLTSPELTLVLTSQDWSELVMYLDY